jgi:hypothetical protein
MSAASAQFQGGLKLGLGLSNLNGDISENGMLVAPNMGFFGKFSLSDAIDVQPELLLFGGGTLAQDGTNLKLQYLGVPVIMKYNVGEVINVQAGPQLSFLFDSNPPNAKDAFKNTDMGLNLGVGGTWEKVLIDVRYCIGLSNISDISGADLKTSLIQISLGYQFFPR